MTYTLDKLVVLFRLPKAVPNELVRRWTFDDHFYCDLVKSWRGYHPAVMQDNYTLQTEEGISFYLGFGTYGKDYSNDNTDAKLEFNPAKVGNSRWFKNLYQMLVCRSRFIDFRRFDVAIDIPVSRSHLRLLKDQRKFSLIEYSRENKTEYLGLRSNHGNVKLYNKALEQKLDYDLTRLELTLDYGNSSWQEFRRIFPQVLDIDSVGFPDNLQGTDLVLYLACGEHPEYLKLLAYKKRKKIEQLLSTTAQFIKPDKILYENILAEILMYGNRVSVDQWADLSEVEFELPDKWTKPELKFDVIEGEQEEMK